jgi:hypothetical protein
MLMPWNCAESKAKYRAEDRWINVDIAGACEGRALEDSMARFPSRVGLEASLVDSPRSKAGA